VGEGGEEVGKVGGGDESARDGGDDGGGGGDGGRGVEAVQGMEGGLGVVAPRKMLRAQVGRGEPVELLVDTQPKWGGEPLETVAEDDAPLEITPAPEQGVIKIGYQASPTPVSGPSSPKSAPPTPRMPPKEQLLADVITAALTSQSRPSSMQSMRQRELSRSASDTGVGASGSARSSRRGSGASGSEKFWSRIKRRLQWGRSKSMG